MKSQLALEPFINYCKKETLSFLRQCFIDVGGAGDNHFIWRWHANIFPMRNTTSSAAKYLNIIFICTQVKTRLHLINFYTFCSRLQIVFFFSLSLSFIHFYIIFYALLRKYLYPSSFPLVIETLLLPVQNAHHAKLALANWLKTIRL